MEEVNPLPIIEILLEKKPLVFNAMSLDITKMIVQSLRKTKSLRRLTKIRRISWQHGMIQNQKINIMMKSMKMWYSWPGPAEEKHYEKTN